MRVATKDDHDLVKKILVDSFGSNKSITYVVKQDRFKQKRLDFLMSYSFKKAFINGNVFINDTDDACLLMIEKNNKQSFSFKSVYLDLLLCLKSIGVSNIIKVLHRESLITEEHPKDFFLHLWYVGTLKKEQGKGKGSNLINDVINFYQSKYTIYLETSTERNFSWYEKLGFTRKTVLDLGYKLHIYTK